MDVRDMGAFEDDALDAVLDKGLLDAILCGDGSGPNSELALNEIDRILNENGVYICISYRVREKRLKYFNRKGWTVFHHMVAKQTISTSSVVKEEKNEDKNFHWVYVIRKGDNFLKK